MNRSRRWRSLWVFSMAGWCGVCGLTGVSLLQGMTAKGAFPSSAKSATTANRADETRVPQIDPARVMGAKACIRCHRSEYARWLKTTHFRSAQLKFVKQKKDALKFAKAMGIPESKLLQGSMCVSCHGTPQKTESGKVITVSGVSCESCHGAAGGDPGWLNRHAVYGLEGTRRRQETPAHRKAREAYCRKHGMVAPENLYALAKKCLSCHIVGHEKLVLSGHPPATRKEFEFASWASGEVRHNYHLDQSKNAPVSSLWFNPVGAAAGEKRTAENRRRVMFVIGALATLETNLRNRANAKDMRFQNAVFQQIAGAFATLPLISVTPKIKAVNDGLTKLAGNPNPTAADFNQLADQVAAAAKDFLATRDGSKLQSLDPMIPQPHFPQKKKKQP